MDEKLEAIDAKVAAVKDLRGEFEQRKFTALLKKPLISSGTILVRGSVSRWDTKKPEPTVMRISADEIRLYYPKQKVLEVYAIDQQLGALAANPLPRLEVLRKYFDLREIPARELQGQEGRHLAVRMTPKEAALQDHIERVVVLLDVETGFIMRGETTDADGDRTVLEFSNIRANTGLQEAELALEVPSDVKITRPLENLGGGGQIGKRANRK